MNEINEVVITTRVVRIDGQDYRVGPLLVEDLALLAERVKQRKEQRRAEQLKALGVVRKPSDLAAWQGYIEEPLRAEKQDEQGKIVEDSELNTALASFWGARIVLIQNLKRHNALTDAQANQLVRLDSLADLMDAVEHLHPKGQGQPAMS